MSVSFLKMFNSLQSADLKRVYQCKLWKKLGVRQNALWALRSSWWWKVGNPWPKLSGPPLWSAGNVVFSHPTNQSSFPGRVNFFEVFPGFSSILRPVRKFRPHSSPIKWKPRAFPGVKAADGGTSKHTSSYCRIANICGPCIHIPLGLRSCTTWFYQRTCDLFLWRRACGTVQKIRESLF